MFLNFFLIVAQILISVVEFQHQQEATMTLKHTSDPWVPLPDAHQVIRIQGRTGTLDWENGCWTIIVDELTMTEELPTPKNGHYSNKDIASAKKRLFDRARKALKQLARKRKRQR